MTRLLLWAVGLVWVVAGAGLILRTEETRRWLLGAFPPGRARASAWVTLALGLLLLGGSPGLARGGGWALLIGLAAVAKAALVLTGPPARAGALLRVGLQEPGERTLRLWGTVALVLGTVLLTGLASP